MYKNPKVSNEALIAISVAVNEDHSVFCLEQLGVPHRVINILYDSGVKGISDLVSKTPDQLLCIPNFGKAQLRVVLEAIAKYDTIEDI